MRKTIYSIIGVLAVIRFFSLKWLYPTLSAPERIYAMVFGIVFSIVIFEWINWVHNHFNKIITFEEALTKRLIIQTVFTVASLLGLEFLMINYVVPHLLPSIEPSEYNTPLAYIQVVLLVFGMNMGFFGVHFFRAWKQKIIEAERLLKENALVQKEFAQMKFTNLQNQLNPHFLFNSIASLNSLIYENQELASEFLGQLAKVYRYVLQHKDKDLVSLGIELDFIENYLFLLKTRFGEALKIDFDITAEAQHKSIVPVTLQVLIENAIKHNIMTEEQPLHITIKTDEVYLLISNNLQRKNIVETSNKLGLDNLKTLYDYLSKVPLLIEENHYFFCVKVPLVEMNE